MATKHTSPGGGKDPTPRRRRKDDPNQLSVPGLKIGEDQVKIEFDLGRPKDTSQPSRPSRNTPQDEGTGQPGLVHHGGGVEMTDGDYDPATWEPTVTHENGATAIGNDPNTANALQFAPRVPGVHNVVIHGNANGFANDTTAAEIAAAVRANPSYTEGTPVCLITCYGSNMSYRLFQELRADVSGYNTTLYVNPNGTFAGGGTWQGYTMAEDGWLLD